MALFHYGLLALLSLTIVATLKAVGLILAIGLLIAPGAIAFLVTRSFGRMLAVAVAVTLLATTGGVYASFWLDKRPGADHHPDPDGGLHRRLRRENAACPRGDRTSGMTGANALPALPLDAGKRITLFAGRQEETMGSEIECYRGVVHPWLCDSMGHMTTRHYTAMFDDASYHLFAALGFTPDHLAAGIGLADVKMTTSFLAELNAGALVIVHGSVVRVGTKSMTAHYPHEQSAYRRDRRRA